MGRSVGRSVVRSTSGAVDRYLLSVGRCVAASISGVVNWSVNLCVRLVGW